MLSKNERLKKSSEFSAVYQLKKSVANSLLILYTGNQKAESQEITKVGFVVSKKISKRSVKRNRIKRLMKVAYKKYIKENGEIRWSKVIFIARDKILDTNLNEVEKSLNHCLNLALKKF